MTKVLVAGASLGPWTGMTERMGCKSNEVCWDLCPENWGLSRAPRWSAGCEKSVWNDETVEAEVSDHPTQPSWETEWSPKAKRHWKEHCRRRRTALAQKVIEKH